MFEPNELHVMVDLETMDLSPTAAIVSIGAVKFNPLGEPGKWAHETNPDVAFGASSTFYANVDLKTCLDHGLTVSGETVRWWLLQSEAARTALLHDLWPLRPALEAFNIWYGNDELPIWCSAASFDFAILRYAYQKAAWLRAPWSHKLERDYRTFRKLLEPIFPDLVYEPPEVAHDSLHDAKAQAKHLQKLARKTHELIWG